MSMSAFVEHFVESKEGIDVKGWRFRLAKEGNLSIREQWNGHDEIWSDGVTISMPDYVVAELVRFLQTQNQSDKGGMN